MSSKTSPASARLLFPLRWFRNAVRAWWFCGRHGLDHAWIWEENGQPYCESCLVQGEFVHVCEAWASAAHRFKQHE